MIASSACSATSLRVSEPGRAYFFVSSLVRIDTDDVEAGVFANDSDWQGFTSWKPRAFRHSCSRRSRSALTMTDTELKVIAALAIIGLSSSPKPGTARPPRPARRARCRRRRRTGSAGCCASWRGSGGARARCLAGRPCTRVTAGALHRHVGARAHGDAHVGAARAPAHR